MLTQTDEGFLRALADALSAAGDEGCVAFVGCASDATRALAESTLQANLGDRLEWRPVVLDRWVAEPMSHIAAYSAGVRRVSVFSIAGWSQLASQSPDGLADALRNLDEAASVLSSLRIVHWIDAKSHPLVDQLAPATWSIARFRHWIETADDRAAGRPSLTGVFDREDTPPGPPAHVASLLELVDAARGGPAEDLAAVLLAAAGAWRDAGLPADAKPLLEEALPHLAAAGDERGRASCLRGIAEALSASGDDAGAVQYLEEARRAFAGLGDAGAAADLTPALAEAWARLGDFDAARAFYEEAAAAFELSGDEERAAACRREAEALQD